MINVSSHNAYTGNTDTSPEEARGCGWWHAIGVTTTAATLTACSSFGSLTGDSTPTPDTSFASRVKSLFSGNSASLNSAASQSAAGTGAEEIDCPSVEYRQGAA